MGATQMEDMIYQYSMLKDQLKNMIMHNLRVEDVGIESVKNTIMHFLRFEDVSIEPVKKHDYAPTKRWRCKYWQ